MPGYLHSNYQNLPEWLTPLVRRLAEASEAARTARFIPYEHERIAPHPKELQEAFAHYMTTPRIGLGEYHKAAEELSKIQNHQGLEGPQFYAKYGNPYRDYMMQNLEESAGRAFREQIMPQIEAKFLRLGQHGSSRHAQLSRQAARDLQESLHKQHHEVLHSSHEEAVKQHASEVARQMEKIKQLQTLGLGMQAHHLTSVGALENVGKQLHQQGQLQRDVAYQNYLRETGHPMEQLAQQSAIMHGLPHSTQGMQHHYVPPTPIAQPSVPGQLGNLALNLYASRMMGGR